MGGEISDEQQRELLRERSEVERQLDRRQEFEKQCDEVGRECWKPLLPSCNMLQVKSTAGVQKV